MQVIVSEVLTVHKLVDSSRVSAIAWQHVDIRREGQDLVLVDLHGHSKLVEDFNARQAEVIHVAPGLQDIELQFFTEG